MIRTAGLVVTVCATAAQAVAQSEPRHEFQFQAGYSPQSTTFIGAAENRRFVMAGFSYAHRCRLRDSTSISFTAGLMPAAVLIQPAEGRSPAHAVYGLAVTPAGVLAEFARRRRLHPFAQADGGIIASTEPIPVNSTNASGLNFLFDFGGGVRWKVSERRVVSLGYKFLHISNAGTTSFNPGVDNNVVYVGYSFLR